MLLRLHLLITLLDVHIFLRPPRTSTDLILISSTIPLHAGAQRGS